MSMSLIAVGVRRRRAGAAEGTEAAGTGEASQLPWNGPDRGRSCWSTRKIVVKLLYAPPTVPTTGSSGGAGPAPKDSPMQHIAFTLPARASPCSSSGAAPRLGLLL